MIVEECKSEVNPRYRWNVRSLAVSGTVKFRKRSSKHTESVGKGLHVIGHTPHM